MKKSFSYNITKRSAMPRSKRLRNIGVAAMSTKNIVAETGDWLPRSEFDEILETIRKEDGTIDYIKAKHTLVSLGDIQSLAYADPIEGGSEGNVVGLLTDWSKYDQATANDLALSAELGHGLLGRIQILEGAGFLTAADISHLATNSALTTHINDTAVHITAAERAKWNKTATDLSAILGADSDTIINKWEEVIAFLDTYTEADTLANLLSHKADKATTLAGYGITDAYTKTALDTLLGNKVSKAGDTMTGPLHVDLILSQVGNNGMLGYKIISSSTWFVGATDTQGIIRSNSTNLIHRRGTADSIIWDSGNMGHGSNLNADLLDGLHASDLFATKTLFSKADYQHYVVLLWKTNETTTHRISGKLYTETAGVLRYQAADIDMWFSRWNSTSYEANLRLVTYGLGTAWKLVTCTYNGEEWYALQHTNTQATAACFVGVSARINFTAVKYYTSNTSTVDNAEIYNSIVDRSNLLKRSYVGDNAIAYITDTVAAAEKLSNNATFTAWGQTFFENGVPKSVSGTLSDVIDIRMSRYLFFKHQDTTKGYYLEPHSDGSFGIMMHNNYTWTKSVMTFDANGVPSVNTLRIGSITLKDVNGHLEIDKTIVSLGDVQSLSDADVVEGGGMIADMLKEWSAYNNSMADTHALSAGLGVELHNRLTGVENSYVSKTVADSLYQPKGNYLTAHQALDHINVLDTRSVNETTSTYNKELTAHFKYNTAIGLSDGGTYTGLLHFTPWSDATGGSAYELAFTVNGNMWMRNGAIGSAWGAWKKILTDANYAAVLDDRYVTRTTAQTVTAKKIFSGSIGLNTISDNWNVARMNNTLSWLYSRETTAANAPGTWYSGVSFMTEYVGFQLAVHGGGGEELKFRKISDGNTWTAWRDILHSGNYNSYALSLTGGTLTGSLTINNAHLIIKHPATTGGTAKSVTFQDSDGTNEFMFGSYLANHIPVHAYIGWGSEPWSEINCLAVSASKLRYKGYDVFHSGNDGNGSGLDADLLDGLHSTDFFRRIWLYNGDDANSLSVSGVYPTSLGAVNVPATTNGHQLLHFNWDVNAANQLFLCYSNSRMYSRSKVGGAWSDWNTVAFLTDNVASATNADKTDGYHADINDTANTLVVRDANGHVNLSAIHLPYSSISEISKYLQLASGGNELIFSSGGADIMYVNYRAATVGTAVTKWIWCAGTSGSRAAMEMGDLTAASLITTGDIRSKQGLFVSNDSYGGLYMYGGTAYYLARIWARTHTGAWTDAEKWLDVLNDCSTVFYHGAEIRGDLHVKGTIVADGDVQSLSNGPDYEEVVRMDLGLLYGNQTVKIPATAKEVTITCQGDQDIMTLQIDGNTSDVDVIIIKVLDSGIGGTSWKYETSNVTVDVPSGGMRTLALVRRNNSILFFGKY